MGLKKELHDLSKDTSADLHLTGRRHLTCSRQSCFPNHNTKTNWAKKDSVGGL